MSALYRVALGLMGLSYLACLLCVAVPIAAQPAAPTTRSVYLPLITRFQTTPFGAEPNISWIAKPTISDRAKQLGIKWVRINSISWRKIQPTRGGAYNVSALAMFERDLQ